MSASEDAYAGIRRHLAAVWPDQAQQEFTWELGSIGNQLPGFRVRRIAPSKPDEPWIYLTVGAWQATSDGHDLEFFLLSPTESPRHVETLAMLTSFHAQYRLSVGRTVAIGRPWLDRSAADHLLVSLPYPFGPRLEHCELPDRHVRFLWLVPITAAEAGYARQLGTEALEQLLEDSGADLLAADRRSLL